MPDDRPTGRPTLHWVGLLLVYPGLVGVLYGLSNVTQNVGAARMDVWAPVAAGLGLLIAFVLPLVLHPSTALGRPRSDAPTDPVGPATDQWWLLAVLLVRGIGTGAVLIPVMSVAYVDLAPSQVPHASIITRLLQQLGGAFGTAVLAVILEGAAAGATTVSDYAAAFDVAFWWATAFTLVAVVACAWLPGRVPQRRPAGVAAR